MEHSILEYSKSFLTEDLIKYLLKNYAIFPLISKTLYIITMWNIQMVKTILVVDDSLTSLFLVKKMVEKAGYNVVQAKSGQECLKMVKKKLPSLVLLDIMLPDLSGDMVFFKLKDIYPKIKVILFSSLALSDNTIRDLTNIGVIGFLRKPLKEEELLNAINKAL